MKRFPVLLPYLLAVFTALSLVLVSCEGEQGPPGSNPPAAPIITSVVAYPDSIGTNEFTTLVVNAYDPNGDAMTYAWTSAAGSFSAPNAASTRWTAPDSLGLYTINVAVTDQHGTTNGSIMVGVNMYVPAVTPSYVGNNDQRCAHCHGSIIEGWHTTPHSRAFANTVIGVEHRTTGWDLAVDNGGYDDNPGPHLENVQCEACHGPMGPNVVATHPHNDRWMTGESCGHCHVQWPEYQYSGHGTAIERAGGPEEFTAEWGGNNCNGCHTGEGFIKARDAGWVDRELPREHHQISCGVCHDPHTWSPNNPEQLRDDNGFTIPYGGEQFPTGLTINNWGNGNACGECHRARRDRNYIMNAINNGAQRANPHPSNQADMVVGRGSYEIPGYTYDRTNPHAAHFTASGQMPKVCVSCHMRPVATPYPHSNHSFYPEQAFCQNCHPGTQGFDVNGKQSEIRALMDQLAQMLPTAHQGEDGHWEISEDTRDSTVWSRQAREAAWAWWFVEEDQTHGVHNYTYSRSLLLNAIDYMTPGVAREESPFEQSVFSVR